jgi:hypothetical protein
MERREYSVLETVSCVVVQAIDWTRSFFARGLLAPLFSDLSSELDSPINVTLFIKVVI